MAAWQCDWQTLRVKPIRVLGVVVLVGVPILLVKRLLIHLSQCSILFLVQGGLFESIA